MATISVTGKFSISTPGTCSSAQKASFGLWLRLVLCSSFSLTVASYPTSREANFIAAKFFLWRDVFIWWSFHWQFPLHRIDTLLYFLCYPQVPLVRTKVNYCNFLVKILSFLSCLILTVVSLKTTTNTQLWIFNNYKIAILAESRANYYHPNQVYSHKSSMTQ